MPPTRAVVRTWEVQQGYRDPSEDQGVDEPTKPKIILQLAGLRLIGGGKFFVFSFSCTILFKKMVEFMSDKQRKNGNKEA